MIGAGRSFAWLTLSVATAPKAHVPGRPASRSFSSSSSVSAWPICPSTRLAWSTSAKYATVGAAPQSRWEKSPNHMEDWVIWPTGVGDIDQHAPCGKAQLWSSTASRLWRIEREAAADSEAADSLAAAEEEAAAAAAAALADKRPLRSRERRDREKEKERGQRPGSRMQRAFSEPAGVQKGAKPRALAAMPESWLGKPSNIVGPIADLRRAHLWTKDFVSSGSPSLVACSDDFGDARLYELTVRHNEGMRMKQERRRRNPVVELGKAPPPRPGKQAIREIQLLKSQLRSLQNPPCSKPASPPTPGVGGLGVGLGKESPTPASPSS